jgi:hypothetical protein
MNEIEHHQLIGSKHSNSNTTSIAEMKLHNMYIFHSKEQPTITSRSESYPAMREDFDGLELIHHKIDDHEFSVSSELVAMDEPEMKEITQQSKENECDSDNPFKVPDTDLSKKMATDLKTEIKPAGKVDCRHLGSCESLKLIKLISYGKALSNGKLSTNDDTIELTVSQSSTNNRFQESSTSHWNDDDIYGQLPNEIPRIIYLKSVNVKRKDANISSSSSLASGSTSRSILSRFFLTKRSSKSNYLEILDESESASEIICPTLVSL